MRCRHKNSYPLCRTIRKLMPTSLCIHGHFYQPPREDPWLGRILIEGSAAPVQDWNERILRESYAPLAWARRLDESGRIADICNCYEWINFNVGPTLMHWLRRESPETLRRMREGDQLSARRLGHGNAMAQIYHHVIMPLAPERDKILESAWAIEDFRFHFERAPEGMWLSECAVDLATLEVLAAQGIRFVILAPRQAKAVLHEGRAVPVSEGSLNIGEPYRVALPSGASITAVFYHGKLSQSIAFEGLLRDGELFWQRIAAEAKDMAAGNNGTSLLCLATDGETYGHHFVFGEMALAHILTQGAAGRDNIGLTNIAAHIAAHPPVREVILHEGSSWSCVHGVERWRSDCGCSDGGHAGWNQQWRAPLRRALDSMRQGVEKHFAAAGAHCLRDPYAALLAYGEVLADPGKRDAFAAAWFTGDSLAQDKAWKLLAMQELSLAAFASCAWFFDDISRIEPENALTFALRAMELIFETKGPDLRADLMRELETAFSNQPETGTGKDIFQRDIMPRHKDPAALCLLAWALLESEGGFACGERSVLCAWPNISVEIFAGDESAPAFGGSGGHGQGRAVLRTRHQEMGKSYLWRFEPPARTCLQEGNGTSPGAYRMFVRPEEGGEEQSRTLNELARPMRDFLLTLHLENLECRNRPALRAAAVHALRLSDPWLGSQHELSRPEFWAALIPYLPLESLCLEDLSEQQRVQVKTILSLHLPPSAKALSEHLLREAFLQALATPERPAPQAGSRCLRTRYKTHEPCCPAEPYSDARLAAWARQVHALLPDMDWWAVQNRIWEKGPDSCPLLAEALYFHR